LATFLDRAPYIWLWRPTYRAFGSWIRECKALITGGDRLEAQFEMRFAKIEATQRETSELLEQLVLTMLGDRQIPRAMEEMQALLESQLFKQGAETSATNSNRSQIAGNHNHAAILESAPRTDKTG
jgi:hypothetical protein